MRELFPLFTGNCPHNVSRDAKYAVRSGSLVRLEYVASGTDRWLITTEKHPYLVEAVNAVKVGVGGTPNGPFYINEFGQVIVPVGGSAEYYRAEDHYDLPLKFEFEGREITGDAVDSTGRPLEPGDLWTGPHPGIPYRLTAAGNDIYYDFSPSPNVKRRVALGSIVGPAAADAMAQRVRNIKGWHGGRFYINEWSEMFAPVNQSGGWEYRYIGHLEENDPWFPKP